jgi:hypothetical protein
MGKIFQKGWKLALLVLSGFNTLLTVRVYKKIVFLGVNISDSEAK